MNNLTESDIKYLKNCVLHSTLLGHEVEKGSEVLRKLDHALNIANILERSEQLVCDTCKGRGLLAFEEEDMICSKCFGTGEAS